MKILAILNERNSKYEEQKRYLQRKEAKETYKKNASYTQAGKNPMLAILENLLSGKTEKELFEKQESNINQIEEFIDVNSEMINLPLFNPTAIKGKELDEILSERLVDQVEIASTNKYDFDSISDRNFEINIPNRFLQNFSTLNFNNLDIKRSMDMETVFHERTYKKAVSTYTEQMEIARQGYIIKPTKYSISA